MPPLRERREDIPALLAHFIRRYSGGRVRQIGEATMDLLQTYPWPGNVRELKNWAERACILAQSDVLDSASITDIPREDFFAFDEKSLRSARAQFEKQFIMKMLSENGGNISKTAQTIGVERSHLHKKIKSYGIEITQSP